MTSAAEAEPDPAALRTLYGYHGGGGVDHGLIELSAEVLLLER
jgi:hypothetical protein